MKKFYQANYQIVQFWLLHMRSAHLQDSKLSNLLRKHIYVRAEEARLASGEQRGEKPECFVKL